MNSSSFRSLPILLLAIAGFSGCLSTREGWTVAASHPRDSEAVIHVVSQTADEFGLRPIYVDDTGGPKVVCAFGRSDGTRVVVTQRDPTHLSVSTNPYHETDKEGPNQALLRSALEARLKAIFPATALRERSGHPPAHWVVENS